MQLLKTLSFTILLTTIYFSTSFTQEMDFFESKTTVGGYGELHYNNNKTGSGQWSHQLDFHRFVLFFGHTWSERWSFTSEVELEHNFVEDGQGELELEQAYVNYHHANYFGVQAGVVLVSAGLINEFHEPPLFFGAERPDYSSVIVPNTWFGNGAAIYGMVSGFDYKIVVMEGLNSDKFSPSSGIRGGRRKGFKADAKNFLYNARVDYTGIPGLRFGASYIFNKANGDSTENKIGLVEFHTKYNANNIIVVFEIGNISYNRGEIEASMGYYFDIGYNIGRLFNIESKIIPFFRYSNINTASQTKSGGDLEKMYHDTLWMAGFSFLPIDQVVFKFDYGEKTRELGNVITKSYNLGVGYMF